MRKRNLGRWTAVTLLSAALTTAVDWAASLAQEQSSDPVQRCLDCHSDQSKLRGAADPARLLVDRSIYDVSAHAGFACADCHQDLADIAKFPHAKELAAVDCGVCHDDVSDDFSDSLHDYAREQGNLRAPDCSSCHGKHDILPSSDANSRSHKANVSKTCAVCHGEAGLLTDQIVRMAETASAYADSVHGRASRRGKETAAVCTDCHGSHAMKGPADATSSVNPQNVAATCGKCHANVQREYDRSIHGRALKAGVRDSPTCTNCHGEHHILSPKDGGSTTYAGRLAKETCGRCHGDPNLSDKYGLPADVLETYSDSYHGWAARSDSAEAATCVDCHTAHWVLPQRDRASTIHPYNVTATCRECHKDATREFAASYTHTTASVAANPVLRWVRNSYWALIALLIGGMALHNLVIVNYYLIEKRRAEKAGLTLLRLDKSQLVQHIVLAVSFIGLVVTGFALRFPESWWASGLAQLGMTESIRGVTHRVLAVVLILLSVWHVLYVLLSRRGREEFRSMLPTKRDITGFVAYMRFHLWLRDREVHFGRYDYTQKAEYWALIWGTAVMAFTGLVLWFPAHAVKWLPTWIVQVSQAIHYYEAWLATLAIAVWHFFFVLFHPKEYPMSWTWLTGRMSAESAQQHHFQWYEEETAKANQTAVAPAAPGRAPRK